MPENDDVDHKNDHLTPLKWLSKSELNGRVAKGEISINAYRLAMGLSSPKRPRLKNDPNYTRLMGENGEEIGILGVECGSHCLVQMAGKHQLVRHCACLECHAGEVVPDRDVIKET